MTDFFESATGEVDIQDPTIGVCFGWDCSPYANQMSTDIRNDVPDYIVAGIGLGIQDKCKVAGSCYFARNIGQIADTNSVEIVEGAQNA
jgi:hypothetical protein